MKKIAIFVEGQGEQIFIRNLLFCGDLVNLSEVSFECIDLRGNPTPFPYRNPNAEVHFQIVNVGNDEKVLSAIKAGTMLKKSPQKLMHRTLVMRQKTTDAIASASFVKSYGALQFLGKFPHRHVDF